MGNLELGPGGTLGGPGAEPPAASRAGRGSGGVAPKAGSFFVFRYPKLIFIDGSSAAGSPRVESLVETFAPLAEPILTDIYI